MLFWRSSGLCIVRSVNKPTYVICDRYLFFLSFFLFPQTLELSLAPHDDQGILQRRVDFVRYNLVRETVVVMAKGLKVRYIKPLFFYCSLEWK